jgi:hypothetical protein
MSTHILAIVLQLAASGADAYYTHRVVIDHHGTEANPIARPFMHSTGSEVAYFATTAGLKIALPPLLRRHHHNKLANIAAAAGIADNAEAATYTAMHVRRNR